MQFKKLIIVEQTFDQPWQIHPGANSRAIDNEIDQRKKIVVITGSLLLPDKLNTSRGLACLFVLEFSAGVLVRNLKRLARL